MYPERKSESRRQVSEKMQGFGEEGRRENQKIKHAVSCKIWKEITALLLPNNMAIYIYIYIPFGFHIISSFCSGIPGFSSILTCPLLSLLFSLQLRKRKIGKFKFVYL